MASTSFAEDSEILESRIETFVYTRFKDMHQEVMKFSNKGKRKNWWLVVKKECVEEKEAAISLLEATNATMYILHECLLKKEENYYLLTPMEEK
jgi:G:T-mismatch repair DNA endonuclease (very short patch repair protein)